MDIREEVLNTEKVWIISGDIAGRLYQKGVYINKLFEELNISNVNLVKNVMNEFVSSGANIITTNTFAANKFRLGGYNLADARDRIIESGIKIAKEVIGDKNVKIAGNIGPSGYYGKIGDADIIKEYTDIIKTFVDNDINIVIFEGFDSIDELKIAISAAGQDIVKLIQVNAQNTKEAINRVKAIDRLSADIIGISSTMGAKELYEVIKDIKTEHPLLYRPSLGNGKYIDDRLIYLTTPEFIAEYTKRVLQLGIRFVGGYSGITPEHIKSIKGAVLSISPEAIKEGHIEVKVAKTKKIDKGEIESDFGRKLIEGKFVSTIELLTPIGSSLKTMIERAKLAKEYGFDAINIPDGPRASARISASIASVILKERLDIDIIPHICMRDKNIIALQSEILAMYAGGIRTMLIITGDSPKLGDYPFASAVFDMDSIAFTRVIELLNNGFDLAGHSIKGKTNIFHGVGVTPGSVNESEEIKRLKEKIKNGADFIITQPVFDTDIFFGFFDKAGDIPIPIIAGVWPLVSYKNALFLHKEVPGANIPDTILKQFEKVSDPEDAKKLGVDIASEVFSKLKPHIHGVQISAPFGKIELANKIYTNVMGN